MKQELERLLGMIDVATSGVATEYFQLPVADADAVYRERVYCYELYHQLRCRWDGSPFSLGGEIDKSGNPHFKNGPYSRAEPDLLVHAPGDMDRNLAVVEIKSANVGLSGIRDDLRKLTWFCQNARYFRGIFLMYGDAGDAGMVAQKLRRANGSDVDFGHLNCLYHRYVGGTTEIIHP